MSEEQRVLMCPPDHFEVDYVINPWMEGNVRRASMPLASEQWQALNLIVSRHAKVELVPPQPGLPDMVFTANAGMVVGKRVALSRFYHRERQGEEAHFRRWFKKRGFDVFELPSDLPFEGAGDAFLDKGGGWLWISYGSRSELDTHPLLARFFGMEVLSLRLVDPRFYHLDTCFCTLEGGYLMYYPPALDAWSNRLIEHRVPAEKRIVVAEPDAVEFACNAVNLGRTVILNRAGEGLKGRLHAAGFEVVQTPLGEFMKAGGAARCLTLMLSEPKPSKTRALSAVQSRKLRLEGHLLDSGLLERALELTVQNGGSFQVLQFTLGRQRQSLSKAEIRVAAPAADVLDKIVSLLISLGGLLTPRVEEDAEIKPVTQTGVAPDDFYSTTIFPMEVRVDGEWVRVQDQRMDGVIVIKEIKGRKEARCVLLRHLHPPAGVVVGTRGIRTIRKAEDREPRGKAPEKEFAFMGGEVSSERRVELVVDQIAWEMKRVREQGGRIVVVAGPVVIHTGGGEHLAWLIQAGYVQALLGGNAIAVHDIEQALLGTSLGLDLQSGRPVPGGHRHHLRAINTVCRCGSIRQAVEQGVLTTGVMAACIRHRTPFVLAGSIRDDGPLPDTQMDLIQAQEDYARLVSGADMILMLSSMLHSIGVGNMTPAGVKLVCVDINPAVVTKLSDRGSLESFGVVTDVGLFLNLLTQRLGRLKEDAVVE